MYRIIIVTILGILTSLFYFPTTTKAFPTINSKMVLAGAGLILLIYNLATNRDNINQKNYIILFLFSAVVSIVGYISIVLNSTPDLSYASYFVSMFVWLIGAYMVTTLIRMYHGKLTFSLLSSYIIGVCVFQCIISLLIYYVPTVKNIVDSVFVSGMDFLENRGEKRLYGIGSLLDTAGIRYSIALVLCASLIVESAINRFRNGVVIYIVCFLIIGFVGNMVARTTIVGIVLGLLYIIVKTRFFTSTVVSLGKYFWGTIIVLTIIAVPVWTYLYNQNRDFKRQIDFGFEGVISLVNSGEWKVGSNTQLKRMVVFPDNAKTWIIGDGYFNNPAGIDQYYTGEITGGYYKNTDIGYIRFIFYFGITGLIAFSIFIIKAGDLCKKQWEKHKLIFSFLILLNFIVWLKVATDIFVIFAYFLANKPVPDETEMSEEDSEMEYLPS